MKWFINSQIECAVYGAAGLKIIGVNEKASKEMSRVAIISTDVILGLLTGGLFNVAKSLVCSSETYGRAIDMAFEEMNKQES